MKTFLKFAVVGGLGTIMNEAIYVFSSKISPVAFSLALAIEISLIFNFVLNDIWTFRDKRNGSFVKRLAKFHGSSYLGNVIQYMVALTLLFYFLHFSSIYQALFVIFLARYKWHSIILLLTNFIGIVAGFIIRFITSVKFVWS